MQKMSQQKHRNYLKILLAVILLSCLAAGCGKKNTEEFITATDQLEGKRIGVMEGASYDQRIRERFPNAEIIYTPSYADSIVAMQNGKLDAYITDEPNARYQKNAMPGITYLPEVLTEDDLAYVLRKDNIELQEAINGVLQELKAEGVLFKLKEEWMEGKGMQEIDYNPDAVLTNGTLKVITSADAEPFTFIKDNKVVGYDIELITLVAERLGYAVEIEVAAFGGLVPSVSSGKSDVAVGCISVTEERKEMVLFTDPVYHSGTVLMVLSGEETGESFLSELATSFQRTFLLEDRWKLVLDGLLVTVELSVASLILGTLLGFGISFPLRSKNRVIRKISEKISGLIDGMPLVIMLMVLYYIVFQKVTISAFWVGICGFTLSFANTTAGLLNRGVMTVESGQLEAAASMGYNGQQIFFKITLPQAVHRMFSEYESAVVGLVKDTSIIGYITVEDLTQVSDIIRSRTYEAFFPLIATAILYFVIAHIFVALLDRVGVRLNPKRRRKVQGVSAHD